MMFFSRSAILALLSLCISNVATAQATHDSPSPTLFTVNGKPVKSDEFVYLYRKNHQQKPEEFTKEKIEEYLDLFVNYKLKVEEALTRGMDTTAAFKKEYQTYRTELLKPYLPSAHMVDSLVSLTYDRLKEEINASHILIAVAPDASPEDTLKAFEQISRLRARALAGEDFGDLAARYSEEPGAKSTRGNLGYFTALQMVFPFEQAAYQTPVGDISQPVRTQYGYHIIKVLDRRPARGEVEVSHIMIRTGDGSDPKRARNLIFDIYDKLQKGMDWDELCRQYSEDLSTKDKGGRLRPFGVGAMSSAPEFEEMAFSLQEKGEISDPFETQFGWHILRLESRIPLPSLEEMRTALTQRVSRDERIAISKEALRSRMKREFRYEENTEARDEVMALADTTLVQGAWKPVADDQLRTAVLFSMDGKTYSVDDFLAFAVAHASPTSRTPTEYLHDLFDQYVDALQTDMLERRVIAKSPEYKWLLKEYYEGILLFEIMEKEVWNKAMEDTVGQRNYFAAHAGDYTAGERVAGTIYSSTNPDNIEELKSMLSSGDSTVRQFISRTKIRTLSGPFEKGDHTVLTSIPWTAGLHVADSGDSHYLVQVEKILPPGPKTFDEARASVISDYQTYLEGEWIKELKAKFGVKISRKAKKQVFRELTDHHA